MLDKLREMTGNDDSRMNTYIQVFKEEMPEYCGILQKAIHEKNVESIAYVAHISKPLLEMFGFNTLHQQANNLELDITNGVTFNLIKEKAEHLLSEMKNTLEELKKNT